MTLKQRLAYMNPVARYGLMALVLVPLLILVAVLTACAPPIQVSDEVSGCPDGYRHVDIELSVWNHAGDMIEGRDVVLVVAAQSLDPEYQGIYVVGTGSTGRNPVVREITTPDDNEPDPDPVICVPVDRAVAVMARVSMQGADQAYEQIECELIDRGIVVAGQPLASERGSTFARLAYDQRTVEISDMIDPNHWYVAQCDWLYVPDAGAPGGVPPLFPRPE
jgi:hypothetical protein